MSKENFEFGKFMRQLRENTNLSIDDAARLIGCGVFGLKEWENGSVLPSELSAQRISRVYNISEEEWLNALRIAQQKK